jgi:protein-disulfide isomerase
MLSLKHLSFIGLAAALALGLTACGKGSDDADATTGAANTSVEEAATGSDAENMTPLPANKLNGDQPLSLQEMVQGDPNAPIELIEYASVTCPHCATFHESIYPAIKEKFVDTGKVKLVYREFPTSPTQLAYIGFAIARCSVDVSGNSESYFATVEALYKNQQKWISQDFKPEILKMAAQAGMDEEAVNACLARQEVVDVINANILTGDQDYGVTGTPTFILDGKKLNAQSEEDFVTALDNAVARLGQ